jgi:alpha-methylacyl-CoA racemase
MLGLHEHEPPLDELPNDEAAAVLRSVFATKTRAQWSELLEGTDACFAPVLSLGEAPRHPHNVARGTFVEVDGIVQPAPAPRFSRTPSGTPTKPDIPGASTQAGLAAWGFAEQEIEALVRTGVVGPRSR